ncbi:MAG TPA: hypothetical protein IGS52_07680 [Oscillatoriaceae cyanobacterium M33_DOE_052]|uniref:Uncharacterized protein n=1 Tax=Planktothricoides sp. SpSt-374 TaxID=2282167 RepID=A0A7C3ZK59_9CYAN|nr:hypothetical protein [Oscillatoriaceae cyanobacterium M33_DOE_052]
MREQHPIHEELKEIFRQAKRATSEEKRKRLIRQGMNRMMTAPPQCFWPGMPPQYRDDLIYIEAAAVAEDYIERKIYGDIRGKGTAEEKAYDPDQDDAASPITLWNKRCEGEYKSRLARERRLIDPNPKPKNPDEDFNMDDVAQAPPPPEPSPEKIIRQAREIIQKDAEGKCRNTFVRQQPPPPITAQEVLLEICDRTSRGEKWTLKILAEHFNVPRGVMNAAWSRHLKPLLRYIGNILREKM